MPSSSASLPRELVDMIVQHLSGDKNALRSCALVSRTWSGVGQHTLYRNALVNLNTYQKMAKILDDLVSVPHLQTLVRGLTIYQRRHNDAIPLSAHMSSLASVLSLLPNLMKVAFGNWDYRDVATQSYLDLIPNVSGTAPLVELAIDLYSVKTFHHLFGILGGTNVKRVSLTGMVDESEVGFEAPRKRLHVPSLEGICFRVDGLQEEFHNCLMHRFDLSNLKQFEISIEYVNGLFHFREVLLRALPPLDLFKLEFRRGFIGSLKFHRDSTVHDIFRPFPLAGLPFRHVHWSAHPGNLDETRQLIEWWSSTFCALSNSKATIHFTELTFALTALPGIETLEQAWNSLDDSLFHMLSSVRSIHFERNGRYTPEKITQAAYPALADIIRLALPRLASRGVLRFD